MSRYNGTKLNKDIIGDNRFPYPKSLYYIEDALRHILKENKQATVLDFFAGSGTTAHAVMRLNQEDDGNRKTISITHNSLSEKEEKDLKHKGLLPHDREWQNIGIGDYVTFPRIKSSILGKTAVSGYINPIKSNYNYNRKAKMSDGIEARASYYELVYYDKFLIEFDYLFEFMSPLLMMKSGQINDEIPSEELVNTGYFVTKTYAVISNLGKIEEFSEKVIQQIERNKNIIKFENIFVITDDNLQYQLIAKRFPHVKVENLYDSYINTFL